MKTIIFHGMLKKLFCKQIKLNISSFKDIFKSLSCNYNDYDKKINKIKKHCLGLAVLVNGNLFYKDAEEIDFDIRDADYIEIIPCSKLHLFGTLVATLIAVGLSKLLANVFAFLIIVAISIGISFLISKLMARKQGTQIKTASYIFSNQQNLAARNTPLSLSYGKLKLGSNVINALIFNFDLQYDTSQILNSTETSKGLIFASI